MEPHRFADIQIWIFVLFLVYATGTELNALFGNGELAMIHPAFVGTEADPRQRIRALVKLSRLIDMHTADELRDRNTRCMPS